MVGHCTNKTKDEFPTHTNMQQRYWMEQHTKCCHSYNFLFIWL